MNAIDNVIVRLTVTAADSEALRRRRGLAWSALGMLGFSLTLTATRAAVPELGGLFVGFGRSVVAAALAVVAIVTLKLPLPQRRHLAPLLRTALGIVIGFPALTAFALRSVPASHAQVFVGLTPLVTAVMAALRGGERLPTSFWRAALLGATSVLGFGWLYAGATADTSDFVLLLAVALVGFGYAEGGRLAREIGGMNVICWALVCALPVSLPVTAVSFPSAATLSSVSLRAIAGFSYVSVISMFLAFAAWYRGLGLGGVARTSQIQLVMPLFGLLWAALLLGERLELPTLLAAALVSVFAFLGGLGRERFSAARSSDQRTQS